GRTRGRWAARDLPAARDRSPQRRAVHRPYFQAQTRPRDQEIRKGRQARRGGRLISFHDWVRRWAWAIRPLPLARGPKYSGFLGRERPWAKPIQSCIATATRLCSAGPTAISKPRVLCLTKQGVSEFRRRAWSAPGTWSLTAPMRRRPSLSCARRAFTS